ncbi:[NiFe]-hydrogenase assembly chaperone HybE [Azohydromonas sediminis]|uniref:[NiFe]-hydrogenase assembly chaperone HybE n=1 Tax=Azohydromonas sediminis TaxID=2259674 RepID=UPI000E65DDB1|nr:[NiFe]-hydrogenase assembly chaperone HybE [Azohydromonas sediminis]
MSLSLADRVEALARAYAHIAATRMAGLPLVHPRLAVATVGFQPLDDDVALGVLVTPWCMNLVRLPLHEGVAMLAIGQCGARDVGARRFDFIGVYESGAGAFEAASLFSPMTEFADQAAARATAEEVLKALRGPLPPRVAQPARRGFLFGRREGAAA